MRSRNDVHGHELTDTTCRRSASIGRRFYSADIATHQHRYIPGADVLLPDENDVGRFDHRIGCFDGTDQTTRLNHPERFRGHARECIIPFVMPTRFGALFALMVLGSAAAGCAKKTEQAAPVATPTVTVNRSDVAVGSPVDITYRFAVAPDAPPFTRDHIVFVHFLDVDREQMWDDDHFPPTPTRQWKPGTTIEYTRTMFVPKFPHVGTVNVEVGLYARESGERLPLAGEDTGLRAYRVASFNMSLQSDKVFVVFRDGWHQTEVEDGGHLEWQWSKKIGTIAFRNPKTDVMMLLEVDQPVKPFDQPQQVEVRVGDAVVDRFSLPSGERQLRRIPLSAAQLGTAENVEVSIVPDRTFVPAAVPSLRSTDARELGIRVFRAYVQGTS